MSSKGNHQKINGGICMKNIFNNKQRLGDIVANFSKAADIFMEYEIDFCCGGNRLIEEAIKEKALNEEEVLSRLNSEYEIFHNKARTDIDWRDESMSDLIDYIIEKHHRYMKKEMPVTGDLLNKILKVHFRTDGAVLSELHKLFNTFKTEIEEHLIKEEELLFPLIKEYELNPSEENREKLIKVMNEVESEHDAAGDLLRAMRKVTKGYELPTSACTTFAITYEKIKGIESDLFRHVHLENNILFDRLENK